MDIKQIFTDWLTNLPVKVWSAIQLIIMDGFFTPWFILKTNCCSYFLCLVKSVHFKCSTCNLHSGIISSCSDLYNVLSPGMSLIPEGQELWDEHGWCLPMALQGWSVSTSLCNGIFSCCWALQLFLYFSKQVTSFVLTLGGVCQPRTDERKAIVHRELLPRISGHQVREVVV